MSGNIRSTNLRFNLNKELGCRAWGYLQNMDKQRFKSYSHVIALALVEFFERETRLQEDPYLETREREERFVAEIVCAVHAALDKSLPVFLAGCMTGLAQREAASNAASPTASEAAPDVDWDFLGG